MVFQASTHLRAGQLVSSVRKVTSATTPLPLRSCVRLESTVQQAVGLTTSSNILQLCSAWKKTKLTSSDMSCQNCPAGNQCPQGAGAPDPCPSGYYATANSDACLVCPAGYECPTQNERVACTSGTYSLQEETTCTSCPAGFLCLDATTEPTACPAGRYNLDPQATECTPCPAGSACPTTSAGPTTCNPGMSHQQIKVLTLTKQLCRTPQIFTQGASVP